MFEYALDSTSGEDLHKVLWLKSRNSEVWLDRRTTYTRSTAVMSMTGYLLGERLGWVGWGWFSCLRGGRGVGSRRGGRGLNFAL